jgi:hypothetical protein
MHFIHFPSLEEGCFLTQNKSSFEVHAFTFYFQYHDLQMTLCELIKDGDMWTICLFSFPDIRHDWFSDKIYI